MKRCEKSFRASKGRYLAAAPVPSLRLEWNWQSDCHVLFHFLPAPSCLMNLKIWKSILAACVINLILDQSLSFAALHPAPRPVFQKQEINSCDSTFPYRIPTDFAWTGKIVSISELPNTSSEISWTMASIKITAQIDYFESFCSQYM